MNIVMLDDTTRAHIIENIERLFHRQIVTADGNPDHIAAGEAYYDLIYGDYEDILNQSPPPLVLPATKLPFNYNTIDFLLPLSKPRRVFAHFTAQQLRPELFLLGDKSALRQFPQTRAFTDAFNRWYRPVGDAMRHHDKWTREIRDMMLNIETVNRLLDLCPPFVDLLPDGIQRALLKDFVQMGPSGMTSHMVKATAEVVTLLVTDKVTGRLPPLPNTPPEIPKGPDIPVTGTVTVPAAAFGKGIFSTANVTTVSSVTPLQSLSTKSLTELFDDVMNKVNHAST